MKKYGLIGYPLSHSFSPAFFLEKFKKEGIKETSYNSYPLEKIEEIVSLIESGISGINVTIPYKESVIPFLDNLSEECRKIKAVNTIKIENGKTTGYNTDVIGFKSSLLKLLDGDLPKKAIILGTGGASKAVNYVLKDLGIRHTYISRSGRYMHYKDLTPEIIKAHKLIVNTTPLGMSPEENTFPDVPYNAITNEHFLYDLVYNPEKTIFLKRGLENGASIMNGYDMLIAQAEASWNIWNK